MSNALPTPEDDVLQSQFEVYRNAVATAYEMPEIAEAELVVTTYQELHAKRACFPMQEIDSRQLTFEFNTDRYQRFADVYRQYLETDDRVQARGLEDTAVFLFMGVAIGRSVMERDFTGRFDGIGPRRFDAIQEYFGNRVPLGQTFIDLFGVSPSGEYTLVDQITDTDVIATNGLRVAICYLANTPQQPDWLETTEDLKLASRAAIKDMVLSRRDPLAEIAEHGLDAKNSRHKGDQILGRGLPNWLLALASSVDKSSFGYLNSPVIWDPRFDIDPSPGPTIVPEAGMGGQAGESIAPGDGFRIVNPGRIFGSHNSNDGSL